MNNQALSEDHRPASILEQNINTFAIILSITGAPATTGLRSVGLHVLPSPRETHATWTNGEPISADAIVSTSTAKTLINVLAEQGCLEKMGTYYSNRTMNPKTKPPSHAVLYSNKPTDSTKSCSIRATYFDDDWHIYFEKNLDSKTMNSILSALESSLEGDARSCVTQLLLSLDAAKK